MTVSIRPVLESDLPIFFAQQNDPEANAMAIFPAREREAFDAHWRKILVDPSGVLRAIVEDGRIAGNVVVWGPPDGRLVGYWIGREFWGRGVATRGLALLLEEITERPLFAHVVKSNVGSIRVLEKCGFSAVGENSTPGLPGGDLIEEWVMKLE